MMLGTRKQAVIWSNAYCAAIGAAGQIIAAGGTLGAAGENQSLDVWSANVADNMMLQLAKRLSGK